MHKIGGELLQQHQCQVQDTSSPGTIHLLTWNLVFLISSVLVARQQTFNNLLGRVDQKHLLAYPLSH